MYGEFQLDTPHSFLNFRQLVKVLNSNFLLQFKNRCIFNLPFWEKYFYEFYLISPLIAVPFLKKCEALRWSVHWELNTFTSRNLTCRTWKNTKNWKKKLLKILKSCFEVQNEVNRCTFLPCFIALYAPVSSEHRRQTHTRNSFVLFCLDYTFKNNNNVFVLGFVLGLVLFRTWFKYYIYGQK